MAVTTTAVTDELYQRAGRELLPRILRQIGDREEALDILQESFVSFLDFENRGKSVREPMALLRTIAERRTVDHQRKAIRGRRYLSEAPIQYDHEGGDLREQFERKAVAKERSGQEIINTGQREAFDEIKKEWYGLHNIWLVLHTPRPALRHREIQTLALLPEVPHKIIEGVRKKLGLPTTTSDALFVENDLGQNKDEVLPYKALLSSSVFGTWERYFEFLEMVKPLLRELKLWSSVGINGFETLLLLENPRIHWATITISARAAPSNTYSKSFFRDYVIYQVLKRVRFRKRFVPKVLESFLHGVVEGDSVERRYAWRFNRRWWQLSTNYDQVRKQQSQLKTRIARYAEVLEKFAGA